MTKISTTSSANLLYSIFARAKRLYRPVAGKSNVNITVNKVRNIYQGRVLLLVSELTIEAVKYSGVTKGR